MQSSRRRANLRAVFDRLFVATTCLVLFWGAALFVSPSIRSTSRSDERVVVDRASTVATDSVETKRGEPNEAMENKPIDLAALEPEFIGATFADDEIDFADFEREDDFFGAIILGDSDSPRDDSEKARKDELKLTSYDVPQFVDVDVEVWRDDSLFDDPLACDNPVFGEESIRFAPSTMLRPDGSPTYEATRFFTETKASNDLASETIDENVLENRPAKVVDAAVYVASRPKLDAIPIPVFSK